MEPLTDKAESFRFDTIQGDIPLGAFSLLLDRAFQVPSGGRFLDDFPVWDDRFDVKDRLRVGAFLPDGTLAACAAARIADLRLPQGTVRAGIIGAVATDPRFRGRGLASGAVELLSAWIANQGAAIAALWGSEEKFYARLGFRPCGTQALLPVASFLAGPADEPIGEGFTPGIFRCLRDRRGGIFLRDEDRSWIGAHRNVKWFYTGTADAPSAYAAVGRGIDLRGIVHEWGGERKALAALLAEVGRAHPGAHLLCSPFWHPEYAQGISPLGLCLAKIFDTAGLPAGFNTPEGLASLWFWGLDSA